MKFLSVIAVAALTQPLFADDPAAGLPDGPEKAVVMKVCSSCHPPKAILGRFNTPKNWEKKVDSMMNRGAEGTPEEVTQINAYLNRNFAFVPSEIHLPEAPGKQTLQKVCGACHPAEVVINRDGQAGTRASWAKTIDRMLYRGAKGTAEELEQINDYLAVNVGYMPVPSYLPDGPGKQTTERVCGPCHGVIMLNDRRRAPAAWSRTVTNMVGRGAAATPADADEITEYLGRYLALNPAK